MAIVLEQWKNHELATRRSPWMGFAEHDLDRFLGLATEHSLRTQSPALRERPLVPELVSEICTGR